MPVVSSGPGTSAESQLCYLLALWVGPALSGPRFLHLEIKDPSPSPEKLLAVASLVCRQFDTCSSLVEKNHFLWLEAPAFFWQKRPCSLKQPIGHHRQVPLSGGPGDIGVLPALAV